MKSTYSYKYFLYAIFSIWLMVPVIDTIADYMLEREFYAFRAWEIVTQGSGQGPFAPSISFEKTIYGDLANMLKVRKFRQYRQQIFTTDSFGFRNRKAPADTYYPIVVIGDSDMAGSSLSDNETFSFQLEKLVDAAVYNYAPYSPLHFLGDERFIKRPPKIVIWENIERTINGEAFRRYAGLPDNPKIKTNPSQIDKNTKVRKPRLSAYISRQIFHEVRWLFTGVTPSTVHSINRDSGMLFFTPGVDQLNRTNQNRDLQGVIAGIQQIQKIFLNRGITLIYLPLPDKENIYRQMLPNNVQGGNTKEIFLEDLHIALSEMEVSNVDIYSLYHKLSSDKEQLYFRDDTHWNAYGVKVAAEVVALYLEKHNLL